MTLEREEETRRLKKGMKVLVLVFICLTGIFVYGLYLNNNSFYNLAGHFFYLMPVSILILLLYHKGMIFKSKESSK